MAKLCQFANVAAGEMTSQKEKQRLRHCCGRTVLLKVTLYLSINAKTEILLALIIIHMD